MSGRGWLVTGTFALAACGGADPTAPIVSSQLIVLDSAFCDDVTVEPDRLLVPVAGHEAQLQAIAPGAFLAGRRNSHDDAAKNNRNGFLRHVTAIDTSGATAAIATELASLEDVVQQGDFDLDLESQLEGTQPTVTPLLPQDAPPGSPAAGGYGFDVTNVTLYSATLDAEKGSLDKDGNELSTAVAGAVDAKLVAKDLYVRLKPHVKMSGGIAWTGFKNFSAKLEPSPPLLPPPGGAGGGHHLRRLAWSAESSFTVA